MTGTDADVLEDVFTLAVEWSNTVMLCTDRDRKYKIITFYLEDGGSIFRREIDTSLAECYILEGRNLQFNKNLSSSSAIPVRKPI